MYGGDKESVMKSTQSFFDKMDAVLDHPIIKFAKLFFIIFIFALILAQIKADEDTKKLAQSLKLRAKDAEPAPAPAPAAPAAEGMQYLGASLNVVPDHTGSASRDSLAEQYRKNMETETLVEAGREPNLYFVPQSRNSAAAASAAATNFIANSTATASGFRDRMSNEEELAQYIGK